MATSRQMPELGMTLVEIMVTLVISSIIAASTFAFFAGQQRIYETQTKVLNIQQNLWAAMEVVARYTRAAGTGMGGCVRPASYGNPDINQSARLASAAPDVGPLTDNLATRPTTGVRAYDGTSAMQWIPPLWIINHACCSNCACSSPSCPTAEAGLKVIPGTDIITVAFGNRTSGTDTDIALGLNLMTTDPGTPITLSGAGTGSMFRAGEFVLLLTVPDWGYGADPTTDRGCTLFQITATPGTTTLPHQSGGGGSVWNPPSDIPAMRLAGGYLAGASGVRNFGELTWVSFFVQRESAGAIPKLMMWQRHGTDGAGAPQVLAEGIEDLQVSFACDTGTLAGHNLAGLNGTLDEATDNAGHTNDANRKTDEWCRNVPADGADMETDCPGSGPGLCNLPAGVRITLVGRTLAPDDLIDAALTHNAPLDIEDHRPAKPPYDQFRRRVLSTTVYPRNNKPQ
jgi:prepilin-type N-terminal cleavage/methylation domain-containing protein